MPMTMTGEVTLPAGRPRVWAMLNDAAVLKVSIPGCQSLEKTSDTTFAAVVKVKIGPVGASFKGKVQLSDIDSPNGYTISGEGEGGVAGFANGGAKVQLVEASAGTVLRYDVQANVGGKIAQLGSRLIDGVAKKMADQFFANFATAVSGPSSAEGAVVAGGPGSGGGATVVEAPSPAEGAVVTGGPIPSGDAATAGQPGSAGGATAAEPPSSSGGAPATEAPSSPGSSAA
jgi:carbon monoxide dehydrogenase subunit G